MATSADSLITIIKTISTQFNIDYLDIFNNLKDKDLLPKKIINNFNKNINNNNTSIFASKAAQELAFKSGFTPNENDIGSGTNNKFTIADIKKLLQITNNNKINISPTALNFANNNGIIVSQLNIQGSGNAGKIILKDIELYFNNLNNNISDDHHNKSDISDDDHNKSDINTSDDDHIKSVINISDDDHIKSDINDNDHIKSDINDNDDDDHIKSDIITSDINQDDHNKSDINDNDDDHIKSDIITSDINTSDDDHNVKLNQIKWLKNNTTDYDNDYKYDHDEKFNNISPRALILINKLNINIKEIFKIKGSGKNGLITKNDVLNFYQ